MGKESSSGQNRTRLELLDYAPLPYLMGMAVLLAGMITWYAQARSGAKLVTAGVPEILDRLPLLLILIRAVVVAFCIGLVQRNRRNRNEVMQRNTELAQAYLRLSAEKQRQQTGEARFRALFLANPHPMMIVDPVTLEYLDVNEAAVKCYGYSREEFLGMRITDIRPAEDVPRLLETIRSQHAGFASRGLWRHRRKDGSTFLVEITVFGFERDERRLELVLAQDVSKRVEAEEALRQSEAALHSLVEHAPFGICRTSINEDRFLTVNRALCNLLGYTRDEILTLKLSTQIYSESRERERIKEILSRNRTLQAFEISARKKNGDMVRVRIWGVLNPNSEGEPDHLDSYIEDITEQSTLEQQVRQVQKLEAVGRLAGGIAHDFNNILVVIKLSTEILLGEVNADSRMSKPLLHISNAADRAASLTKQLLAFSRQQVMQVRTINVNSVVSEISHLLRRIIGEDVQLVTKLNETVRNTRLDSDQLGQVLMNLAVNARDAMPDGGTLHIETDNVELDSHYAQEHAPVQAGSYVMIAVSDSGCGMEKNLLPHIFDPFFTTKPVGKGTGLGLSIVYGIVKQSGGYIWVYSEPRRGTTFKIYFPVESSAIENPVSHEAVPHLSGRTVLLVEDDAAIRSKLRECLVQLGYEVVEAEDGQRALELCDEPSTGIDVVLTDLVMPRLNGHELAKKLAEREYRGGVVFMSGYTEDNATRRDIVSKGNLFLQKPFSIAELSQALSRALLAGEMEPEVVRG